MEKVFELAGTKRAEPRREGLVYASVLFARKIPRLDRLLDVVFSIYNGVLVV